MPSGVLYERTMNKAKRKKQQKQLKLKGISAKIKPTPQDVLIAKNLVAAGMRRGKALVAAGVSPKSAAKNSAEYCNRPGVRAALAMALEEAGVTIETVAEKLDEGMRATKVISANLLVLGKADKIEGGIIDATEDSKASSAFVRVEDFPTRHKYLETSCKLLDLYPREQDPGGGLPPDEELGIIERAEQAAGTRDISRYTVIHERR